MTQTADLKAAIERNRAKWERFRLAVRRIRELRRKVFEYRDHDVAHGLGSLEGKEAQAAYLIERLHYRLAPLRRAAEFRKQVTGV